LKKSLIIISLALFAIVVAGLLSPTNVNAQDQKTVLQFDPATTGMTPGSDASISVVIENAQDLYALEFHVSFNPQLIEVVDADQTKDGIQIVSGDAWKDGFIAVNKVDNNAGKIDFAATLLNPATPISGKQTVALITFKAKKDGTSSLNIDSSILSTRDAQEIETTEKNGVIGVSSSGVAPDANATLDPEQVDVDNGIGMSKITLAVLAIVVFLLAVGVLGYAMMRKD
jgi:hypothetical protein